tara:strand:+ start:885 stop:1370 length:486 start_codon:yes stop_codon:yes gene_type:complete
MRLLVLLLFLSSLAFGQKSSIGKWSTQDIQLCIDKSKKTMYAKDKMPNIMMEIYYLDIIDLSRCKCKYLENKLESYDFYDSKGRFDINLQADLVKNSLTKCINDSSQLGNWTKEMKNASLQLGLSDCQINIIEKNHVDLFDALSYYMLNEEAFNKLIDSCE